MKVNVSVTAHTAGSEHWYVDHDVVRRVRVRSFQYTSHAPDGTGSLRHYLDPVDDGPASKGRSVPRALLIDVAYLRDLHDTREAAEASLAESRERHGTDVREAAGA